MGHVRGGQPVVDVLAERAVIVLGRHEPGRSAVRTGAHRLIAGQAPPGREPVEDLPSVEHRWLALVLVDPGAREGAVGETDAREKADRPLGPVAVGASGGGEGRIRIER